MDNRTIFSITESTQKLWIITERPDSILSGSTISKKYHNLLSLRLFKIRLLTDHIRLRIVEI
ncbi:hypothetical protein [Rhodohalobacter sp.]|uniref:hypothetical protein n=1 Tax=Rhodohalobacter sp. TaxID=1974210 RepID=UPI003566CAC0